MSNSTIWHKHKDGEWHKVGKPMVSLKGNDCTWDTFYRGLGKPYIERGGIIYYQKKGKAKMEKIYWNDKDRQVIKKDGECIWDKDVANHHHRTACNAGNELVKVNGRIFEAEKKSDTLKAQLQCGAKGHKKWEYVNKILNPANPRFIFRCSNCDLVIVKTEKELTIVENEALHKLKLL